MRSELIAGRIAESRARLKARGLRIAGALPFGYDRSTLEATQTQRQRISSGEVDV
jgi:hypothetical protein